MKKVALYIRVSTEEQARIQEGSLVSQRQRLNEYVDGQNRRTKNWGFVSGVYVDEGKSAKDMNRPEFQRMLQDLRLGKIDLILATELSRLSRSIRDFCELWDLFKKHNSSFVTLREQFDTTTAAGEMMVFNLINFAQFERKQTSERITANFKSRAERGLWNGGQLPLGYKRNPENPGKLLVDKSEAKTVRLIFKTFLDTGNLRETCIILNEQGFRTKAYTNQKGEPAGGNYFTVQSLHHLLTNSTFLGLREINKKRGDKTKVKAQWDGIIDKPTFAAVQKKLERNKRKFKPDSWKTYPYPLTGIATCGECGKALNGKSAHGKNKKHHYYDHPRTLMGNGDGHLHKCQIQRLRAPKVEELVLSSLKTLLTDQKRIKEGVRIYQKNKLKSSPLALNQIKSVTTELKQAESKEKNIISRISELPSGICAEPFYEKLKLVQNEIQEKQLIKVKLESQNQRVHLPASATELEERIKRVVSQLEATPVNQQRAIFEKVIQFAEFLPNRLRLGVYSQKPEAGALALASGDRYSFRSIGGSTTIKVGGEGGI